MPTSSKWKNLPTEAINPASLDLDKATTEEIIDLMLKEDRKVVSSVYRERNRIAMAADLLTASLRKGGRLVFVGAGTSGRLGVLEAAEMVPTFSTSLGLVQALMPGGRAAFFEAKEGTEENYADGSRSISRLRPTRKDVLIGVSASGMTQYVRGALTRARRSGVKIIFITCWPGTELETFVDVVIAPAVGPEVIAGSTRLKAGTATKLVLNMLTTISMVHMGKTYGNLMVDVKTGSDKARDRARRADGGRDGLAEPSCLSQAARGCDHVQHAREWIGPAFGAESEDPPDLVPAADVGDGVRARGPADRRLVHEDDPLQVVEPRDGPNLADRLSEMRLRGCLAARQLPLDGPIEDVVDEGGLPRARDARHRDQGAEREIYVHLGHVVEMSSTNA